METAKTSPLLENIDQVVSKRGIGCEKVAERLHEVSVGKARQILNGHFGGSAGLDQD